METDQIKVAIKDSGTALPPTELADFLFLFRALTLAIHSFPKAERLSALTSLPIELDLQRIRARLSELDPQELSSFLNPKAAADPFKITQITRHSPLELVICGSISVLTLAVIFSGGKVKIPGGGEFRLPPIGKGIAALRDAFPSNPSSPGTVNEARVTATEGYSLPLLSTAIKRIREALGLDAQRIRVGFGLREVTISLNDEEFDALMRNVTGEGGFQTFLRDLQRRVSRRRKTLVLRDGDLERIYRYKREPRKGGWQSKFNTIFGRHFPGDRFIRPKKKRPMP